MGIKLTPQKIQIRIFRKLLFVFLLFGVFNSIFLWYEYNSSLKSKSYLPPVQSRIVQTYNNEIKCYKLKNAFFTLFVDEKGGIIVKSNSGEIILSDLSYYSSYEDAETNWGLNNVRVKLSDDSTVIINGEGALRTGVIISMTVPKNEPKLNFKIKTFYNENTVLRRESLVAGFNVPVSAVYKKNRQVDTISFQTEYWLERQGVRFGESAKSALIYHPEGISSLQLDSKNNKLFINLDYYLDHPYVHIPYQKDNLGRWEDWSTSFYSSGKTRANFFSIYFGNLPKVIPRIMLVPFGNLAGYIFTEHADGGNIKTHRAVYFGKEDIINAKNALGGFVGHKIPVTKSVFYDNPDARAYCSIKDDPFYPEFLNFLDQLNQTGLYDICLHTPEGLNSNRKVLKESIKFMKERFDTKTWIDHGMYSGKINREAFVADGLNPNSKYYAGDFWKKYNTCYFWNSAVEIIEQFSRVSVKTCIKSLKFGCAYKTFLKNYLSLKELNELNFVSSFIKAISTYIIFNKPVKESNSLMPSRGEAYPTPLFWSNHPVNPIFSSTARRAIFV